MKVGIDLGGSHIAIGVINNKNEIIEKHEKDFSEDEKKQIISTIETYIIDTVQEIEKHYEIENIGIAVPGVAKDGVILKTVNLGINNYNIAKILNGKLNKSVNVRNDVKCACLAEYDNMLKKAPELKNVNMIFLGIGTGIGGGVIYNGKLLQGNAYEGFEIGHIIIKENGIPCKCGKKGCFERYGSILEFKNKVKARLNIDQSINGEPLRDIMNSRREEFEDLRKQYVQDLSIGISNLINIFEPDIVVLGGGFTHFSYMFIQDIKEALLNSALLFNRRTEIDIRIAELGNEAGIIGAVL